MSLKRIIESVESYDKALEITPDIAGIWSSKGIALYFLEKYHEAIDCSNKALEIDPNESGAWELKRVCLKAMGL